MQQNKKAGPPTGGPALFSNSRGLRTGWTYRAGPVPVKTRPPSRLARRTETTCWPSGPGEQREQPEHQREPGPSEPHRGGRRHCREPSHCREPGSSSAGHSTAAERHSTAERHSNHGGGGGDDDGRCRSSYHRCSHRHCNHRKHPGNHCNRSSRDRPQPHCSHRRSRRCPPPRKKSRCQKLMHDSSEFLH